MNPYNHHLLLETLCILETPKQVFWQTVKTQMKCSIQNLGKLPTFLAANNKMIFPQENATIFLSTLGG